jgi:hypothetical protein
VYRVSKGAPKATNFLQWVLSHNLSESSCESLSVAKAQE